VSGISCCSHCAATALQFDERIADRDRDRYRRRGPDPSTRLILEEIRLRQAAGADVLDVGGGIGVIGLELLGSGLRRVVMVDASPAYLTAARGLFAERGAAERLETRLGDFATLEPLPGADIVTLDRVVCCYPDYRSLLSRATGVARRMVALSYPRNRWYVRLAIRAENLVRRLRGSDFRAFVHAPEAMARVLSAAGLRRAAWGGTLVWAVEIWVRDPM
jgi:magnesium-protoporphyrin O-methyltransferase